MHQKESLFRSADGKNYFFTFSLVCTLFFLWGFCNGLLDILNRHFQNSLHINRMESAFVQFANYGGYFFMAIPSGLIARWFGYKGGILTGLSLIALGAFWFIPAVQINQFWAFLAGLFVLATGLTCLETIANPYTTVLGSAEGAAARINIAQVFNALATTIAPTVGGWLVLSSTSEVNTSNASLYIPYLIVGGMVLVLWICFFFASIPDVGGQMPLGKGGVALDTKVSANQHDTFLLLNLFLAVLAQFLYVAAQVGIFSYALNFFVSKIEMPAIPAWLAQDMNGLHMASWIFANPDGSGTFLLTDQGGANMVSFGFCFFLAGRIAGSFILSLFSAHNTLGVFAVANVLLMSVIILPLSWFSVGAILLSFFFMSIMYPTVFALGIRGLGQYTKLGASLIVMAIVGGAVMPFIMGYLSDTVSMRFSFIVPLICFAYVAVYAFLFPTLQRLATGHAVED